MDYQAIFHALLPDLIVVVALFAALGVDYGYLRGASMNKRAGTALQICSVGLMGALALLLLQLVGSLPLNYAELQIATHGGPWLKSGSYSGSRLRQAEQLLP